MLSTTSPYEWVGEQRATTDNLWETEWGSFGSRSEDRSRASQAKWHAQSSWGSAKWSGSKWGSDWKLYQPSPQQPPTICYIPVAFPMTKVTSATAPFVPSCTLPTYIANTPSKAPNSSSEYSQTAEGAAGGAGGACRSPSSAVDAPAVADKVDESAENRGELPSVGSEGHFDGSCKRCAFFPKGRCKNGADCTHCHFDHQPRARQRNRAVRRGQQRKIEASTGDGEELAQDYDDEDPKPDSDVDAEMPSPEIATSDMLNDSCADDATEETEETTAPSVSGSEEGTAASAEDSEKTEGLASERMSWSEHQRRRRVTSAASGDSEESAVEITRMARSLLNKLTEERFEPLCSQILALPLSTPDQLAMVAAEIFEKAATQDGFRELYTELCLRMDTHLVEESSAIGGKAFRKALVGECQASFERHAQSTSAAALAELSDEEPEVALKLKTHRLGNMRFIGELLVRRLLAPKLIVHIVNSLMIAGDELAIESLIALLMIIAPSFESKESLYQGVMKDAFATLRRKQNNEGTSKRLCCQISDLLDAKARGWAAR